VVDDPSVVAVHELRFLMLRPVCPLHPAHFEVVHVGDEARADLDLGARRADEVVALLASEPLADVARWAPTRQTFPNYSVRRSWRGAPLLILGNALLRDEAQVIRSGVRGDERRARRVQLDHERAHPFRERSRTPHGLRVVGRDVVPPTCA
jgi:hypothetical protein